MPQYRLTQKFARHLKITRLQDPLPVASRVDEWCIDAVIFQRKRIAMATHVQSLLTFLLPYQLVGRVRNVPDCLPVLLNEFLLAHDLEKSAQQVDHTFSETPHFCKTTNRQLLGHMNDFKRCLSVMVQTHPFPETQDDWDTLAYEINDMPVNVTRPGHECTTRQTTALALFADHITVDA